MAETNILKADVENIRHQITAKMHEKARAKIKRIIHEQKIKPFTKEDFERQPVNGQTQTEIQAEVDDFLRLHEEWRKPLYDRKID